MPKFFKKIEREVKRVRDQAIEVVKETRNELSKDIAFYKGKLSAIGIGYDDEHANLKVPSSGESTQPFKWNWLTSTTGSNSDQVEAFKKIIEVLEAKNNPDLYQKLVSELNANTKNVLDDNIKQYNITVPTQQTNDQKVTLINGKEVEFKKFLELLYTGKKEELTFYWNKLSSEDKKKLSQEMTLTAAYKLFKDQIDFQQVNDLVATITSLDTDSNIPDLFKRASDMNEQQLHEQEEVLMGGAEYSYLDTSFQA